MTTRLQHLSDSLYELYKDRPDLILHGWHHIHFVSKKTQEFADDLDVDKELIEAAGLVHDLNYIVEAESGPGTGQALRKRYLSAAGFSDERIKQIESIVIEAHTDTGQGKISNEAKVLRDADSVFAVMPLTAILMSGKYIVENHLDLAHWARKIIVERQHLVEKGVFFYTKTAKRKYLGWAKANLETVQHVEEALRDPDTQAMLRISDELGVTQLEPARL
jgi:uncharacterized protein